MLITIVIKKEIVMKKLLFTLTLLTSLSVLADCGCWGRRSGRRWGRRNDREVRSNENTQVMFGPGVIDLRDGDISDDGLVEASVFSRNNGY